MTDTHTPPMFPHLAEMRAAHNVLMARYRAERVSPALIADIRAFLERGQATGAVLDSNDERWTAQGLLDYWVATLDRAGAPDVSALLADFDPDLAPDLKDTPCPYVGLNAFDERDQPLFFGRQRVVRQLIELLACNRLLAIVGPSGSGKSSLVRAGLVPALRHGALPASAEWRYAGPMVPGSAPLTALEQLLPASSSEGAPLLLLVDQFEETFTLCTSEQQREGFIDRLVALITEEAAPHRVVLTMRSDFEPYVTRAQALYPLFAQGKFSLPPLAAPELREAIEGPALLAGLKFEAGVVDQLLLDVLGEPAALPLLQFTLVRLWEERTRNRVTLSAYQMVGGGRRALALAADALYERMIPEDQRTARRILLSMVSPGEGQEVTSRRVRVADLMRIGDDPGRVDRVLTRFLSAQLLKLSHGETAGDAQVELAHEALARNWPTLADLVERQRVALRQRRSLTTAAEQWQRLGHDKGALLRGSLLLEALEYDDLTELEQAFVAASSATEEAERRHELEQARQIAANEARHARRMAALSSVLAVVLMVAIALGVLAFSNYLSAEEGRRQAVVQVRVAIASRLASQSQAVIDQLPQRALLLAAEALNVTQSSGEPPSPAARTAVYEALRRTGGHAVAQIEGAAQVGDLSPDGRWLVVGNGSDVAKLYNIRGSHEPLSLDVSLSTAHFLADGRLIGAAQDSSDTRVLLWTIGEDGPVGPAEQLLERLGSRTFALIADTSGKRVAVVLAPFNQLLPEHTLAPTSHEIALLTIPPAQARSTVTMLGDTLSDLPVQDLAFNDDSSRLAVTYGFSNEPFHGSLLVWDLPPDRKPSSRQYGLYRKGTFTALAFEPDGRTLIVGDSAGGLLMRNVVDSRLPLNPGSASDEAHAIEALAVSRDGRWVAGSDANGGIELYPVRTIEMGKPSLGKPRLLSGHVGPVVELCFTPDGRYLFSAGQDGTARRWQIDDQGNVAASVVLRGHEGPLLALRLDAMGNELLTAGADGMVRRWSVADPVPTYPMTLELPSSQERAYVVRSDASGQLAVGAGPPLAVQPGERHDQYPVYLWPLPLSDAPPTVIPGPRNSSGDLAFSPDGRWLAAGVGHLAFLRQLVLSDTLRVWDLQSSTPAVPAIEMPIVEGAPGVVAFSPDSRYLAVGPVVVDAPADHVRIRLLDLAAADPAARPATLAVGGSVLRIGFSADGDLLFAAVDGATPQEGAILLWDVQRIIAGDTEPAHIYAVKGELPAIARMSPDSRWIAVSGKEVTPAGDTYYVYLWDTRAPELPPRRLRGQNSALVDLAFNPDSTLLAGGGHDAVIWLWDLRAAPSQPPYDMVGHETTVAALAFSPDGRSLLSGDIVGRSLLWDLSRLDIVILPVALVGNDPVTSVAFTPDGNQAVISDNKGRVWLWDLRPETLIDYACDSAGRNLRPDEWVQYFGAEAYRPTCP